MNNYRKSVLILGGSGFIGSNIVKRFLGDSYRVVVIDGLLSKTGGRKDNLKNVLSKIKFIDSDIQAVKNLGSIIDKSKIIIDCMGWTSHRLAILDPNYDLKLNVKSHLYLISHLRNSKNRVIYLGSRGQYGRSNVPKITEDTPMIPMDIQGIHKLAAESYFRIYSKLNGFDVVSIRFPNCFGENQPVKGDDIGLVGGFIRDILNNREIEVFGNNRKRNLVYVKDLAEVVFRVAIKPFSGYLPFNLSGHDVFIEDLMKLIIKLVGKGEYRIKSLPHEIRCIDTDKAIFRDDKLKDFIGEIPRSDLKEALTRTLQYFRENIYD